MSFEEAWDEAPYWGDYNDLRRYIAARAGQLNNMLVNM